MFVKLKVLAKNLDWFLLAAVLLLVCLGLAEVYSVTYSQGFGGMAVFKKQLLATILGVILMFALVFIDYYFFYSYNHYFYLLAVGLLVAVLFFGRVINSTKGWFYWWGFGFQPVELVKFILLVFLARYFADAPVTRSVKNLAVSGLGVGLLVVLVLLQPDLGSAAILFALWFFMIMFLNIPKRYLLSIIIVLIALFMLSWQFFLRDYQKKRIMSFVAPDISLSRDYNVNQAMIAVGAGGWFGRGLGFGSQSQLKFLPEAKNDFIFAVIAEELGFLGVALTLFFFACILYRILANIKKINNDFGVYFLLGAAALIFIEMFINIGMNMGLLPIIGIGLPFLSYGGSAMLANLIIIGIVESIIIRSKIKNY